MNCIAHGFGADFTAAQFRDKLDNGRKVAILSRGYKSKAPPFWQK